MIPVPEAQVLHHVPGRLRLRVPRLKQEPALEGTLTRGLREVEGVLQVHVRPLTGSVLVIYEADGRNPEALLGAVAPVVRVAPPASPLEPGPSVGQIAAARTYEQWSRLDERLKRATGGTLDLGTIVPFFFLFLAVRQILTQPVLTALPWYVALQCAFQSFDHYYRRPDGSTGDAVAGPADGAEAE